MPTYPMATKTLLKTVSVHFTHVIQWEFSVDDVLTKDFEVKNCTQ